MKSQIIVIDDERNNHDNHDDDQEENKTLELDYLRSNEKIVISNDQTMAMQELDFEKTLKKNFYLTDDEGRRRVCQRFHTLPHEKNEFVILNKDIDFMQNL